MTGSLESWVLINTCKDTAMQDFPCHKSPSYPGLWTLISTSLLDDLLVSEVAGTTGHPGVTRDIAKEAWECPPGLHCTNVRNLTTTVSSRWSLQKRKQDCL